MKRTVSIISKAVLLAIAIYLRYFSPYVPSSPTERNVVYTSLRLVMILMVLNLAYDVVRAIYRSRNRLSSLLHDSFIDGVRNIFIIISGAAVGATIFGYFGIDFKTLFTTLSIVAAAIAIVTREFINDMLVGIYLGFSSDFDINDYIRINGEKGKILEIGLLKLKILNEDDDVLLIPNGKVYSSEVTNYTKRDFSLMSIDFEISLSKIKGIDELEDELIHSLEQHREFIHQDSFMLKIVEVQKDHLNLKFQYRLKNLDREMQRQIRRKTVRQVLSYITERPSLDRSDKA